MVIDPFESVNTLLYWLKQLDNLKSNQGVKIEEQFKVGSLLIPRWKNYITTHSDFYDRYPEMVSHGSAHIANMCTLAAELLVPPIRTAVRDQKAEDKIVVNNAELFLLITGIFFHDLGMSAVDQTAHSLGYIRTHHSQLSARVIDNCYRQRHQLNDYDPNNLFPNASLWEEQDIEIIKRVCMHHQSSAPITDAEFFKDKPARDIEQEDAEESQWKAAQEKEHPSGEPGGEGSPPLTKKKYAVNESLAAFVEACARDTVSSAYTDAEIKRVTFLGKPVNLLFIAALLRIIDAIDIQYSRLGSTLYATSKIDEIRHKIEDGEKRERFLTKNIEPLDLQDEDTKKYLSDQLATVREELGFLHSQIPDHFQKHASIEKVWLVPDEPDSAEDTLKSYTVVYSLPDSHADSMFLSKITSSSPTTMDRAFHLKEELCKELSAPILITDSREKKVELRHKKRQQGCTGLKGEALIGNGLNEILAAAGMKINLRPREFDPQLHKNRIFELQQFGPQWNYIPGRPRPILNEERYEEHIGPRIFDSIAKYGGGKAFFFIGPEGSGKTTFSRTLANYLFDSRVECLDGNTETLSICYIPCEGLKRLNENENINYLINRFVFFLASQGDFLFYNLLRNNLSIDESYWPYLFGKLNRRNYVFIFDDIHILSRKNSSFVTYRFLWDFFETLTKINSKKGQATVIGFSQKLPAMLRLDKQNKNPILLALPRLTEKDIQKAFSKRYVGPEIVRHPELRTPIEKLLRRYQEYPVVLEYIRLEESRITAALQSSSARVSSIIESAMKTYLKQRVYGKIGTEPSRETIHYLHYYPVTLENYPTLCRFLSTPNRAKNEITELLRRAFLVHIPDRPLYFTPLLYGFIMEQYRIPRRTTWWQGPENLDWFDFLQSKNQLEVVRISEADTFSLHSQAVFERLRRFFTLDFTDENTGPHSERYNEQAEKTGRQAGQGAKERALPIRLPGRPDLLLLASLHYRSSDVEEQATLPVKDEDSNLPAPIGRSTFNLSPDEQRYIDFILLEYTRVRAFLERDWEAQIDKEQLFKTLIKETSLYYTQEIDLGADTTDDILWLLYAESRLKEDQERINALYRMAAYMAKIKEQNPKLTEPKLIEGEEIIDIGTRKGIVWNTESHKKIGEIKHYIKGHKTELELHTRDDVLRWLEDNIETFFN